MPNEKDETMTTGKEEQERRGRNMIEPVSLLSSLSLSARARTHALFKQGRRKTKNVHPCVRAADDYT